MLNQRQLYFASKLYMSASKQSLSFDLPKFTTNQAFAAEILNHLQTSTLDSALLDLIAQTRESLGSPVGATPVTPSATVYDATQPLKVITASDAPTLTTGNAPNASTNGDEDDENAPNRYVGRLR